MKIALLVTTYNSPRFLSVCLNSVREQTVMPDEVVVAEDIMKMNDERGIAYVKEGIDKYIKD